MTTRQQNLFTAGAILAITFGASAGITAVAGERAPAPAGAATNAAAVPAAAGAAQPAEGRLATTKLTGPAARGEYLVTIGSCHDCHTPMKLGANGPEPDMARMLSGHPQALVMPPAPKLAPGPWMGVAAATMTAWAGPWGVSFTANLTPDKETGLGKWTSRTFIDTVRSGRHMGRGRPILPPMPVQNVAQMTDSDLEAVFAFLQSIPAVHNQVPQPLAPTTTVSSAHP